LAYAFKNPKVEERQNQHLGIWLSLDRHFLQLKSLNFENDNLLKSLFSLHYVTKHSKHFVYMYVNYNSFL
jgi:hypothetical protein